jgi:CHAT domain-containing protein
MKYFVLGLIAILAVPAGSFAASAPQVLDGAFRDAQMATGTRTALALSRSAARLASGDPELSRLILARQDASQAASKTEAARIKARTALPADPALIESTAQAADAARKTFQVADAALSKRSPGYAQLTGIAPVTVKDAQALLAPDEAIVLIHTTDAHTYIFAITAQKADWARTDLGRVAMDAEVRALRFALDPDDAPSAEAKTEPRAFPRARAFGLYTSIWGPVAPIIGNAKTVYVVTGGSLGGLPLALLPTQKPNGSDGDAAALRKTPWLIRKHALVTLPSVGSLRALRAGQSRVASAQPFAGFGDPSLNGAPGVAAPRSFSGMRGAALGDLGSLIRTFPQLPGSRAELDALAKALGADEASVKTGAAATEAAVKSSTLDRVSVVAFATHGLLAGEIGPLAEPALVMTPPVKTVGDDDGLLTASEAAALHLGADWVILSACNTAAPDGTTDGEGLSGLARGFFSAGARAILASHWRVRDDVAQSLTVGTLSNWRTNPEAGRAQALRAAMLSMIDSRDHKEWASPSFWAPFVIAGDGR